MFCRVFDHPLEGKEIGKHLLDIKQRRKRAANYALEFHMLRQGVDGTYWYLRLSVFKGLNSEVLTELNCTGVLNKVDSECI